MANLIDIFLIFYLFTHLALMQRKRKHARLKIKITNNVFVHVKKTQTPTNQPKKFDVS